MSTRLIIHAVLLNNVIFCYTCQIDFVPSLKLFLFLLLVFSKFVSQFARLFKMVLACARNASVSRSCQRKLRGDSCRRTDAITGAAGAGGPLVSVNFHVPQLFQLHEIRILLPQRRCGRIDPLPATKAPNRATRKVFKGWMEEPAASTVSEAQFRIK